jgi:hypothetical protein
MALIVPLGAKKFDLPYSSRYAKILVVNASAVAGFKSPTLVGQPGRPGKQA